MYPIGKKLVRVILKDCTQQTFHIDSKAFGNDVEDDSDTVQTLSSARL